MYLGGIHSFTHGWVAGTAFFTCALCFDHPSVLEFVGVDWWSLGILIYELVFGVTPFRGARRDETFENIIKSPLRFPAKPIVSDECRWVLVIQDLGGLATWCGWQG